MQIELLFGGKVYQSVLCSQPSNYFIIITNENQWEEAEKLLIIKDAFNDQELVPYFKFCNTLQRFFFRASRQDPHVAFRRFAPFDFNYIQEKFFLQQSTLNRKDFNKFWEWFGKTILAVRHQRPINKLWQNGLIYGFLNRNDVITALKNHDPGTFIVRFSDSQPGKIAIAYVSLRGEGIKHYLIKPTDITSKTVADFLCECNLFIKILQFVGFNNKGLPLFKAVSKTDTMKPFISHSLAKSEEKDAGYDPLEYPITSVSFSNNLKRKRTN
jgi:hypothetical protein